MMNQYYGFSGRGGHSDYNRAPYRRPMNRGTMPGCMSNRTFGTTPNHGSCLGGNNNTLRRDGGCGCGMNEACPHTHADSRHDPGHDRNHTRNDRVERVERAIPVMNHGECGCGNHGNSADCKRLMDQIRAVDFALYETVLYLDVYPHSCDALETYHKLKAQSEALHAEYEASCAPMTAFGNKSDSSWDWMSKPFPWEYDAD